MKRELIENFEAIYNIDNPETFFSPGRVNLIGEHIDYNGGFVMPCALSYGTYGASTLRDDKLVKVYSDGFSKEVYSFNIDTLEKDPLNSWVDYIKGVIKALIDNGHKIDKGFNLYIKSTMPTNAGLSSSASIESLIVYLLDFYLDLNLTKEQMALIGKEAENKFVGVNSGIMDQFSIIAGKENNAIILNTENLEYSYIPLELNEYQLLVINTNKKRGLADSKYNERFNQCRTSLEILKGSYDIKDLCELKVTDLPNIEKLLDPTLYIRVKHVVTEQDRTIKAKVALENNNIEEFSKHLINSHNSLRDDYDVTGIELDTLVELALEAGAIGSRMTGAGFGGCTVNIVRKDLVDSLINEVTLKYIEKIGYKPDFYVVEPSDGTKLI